MTQRYAREEAFKMIADSVETLVDKHGFSVIVHPGKSGTFEVSSSDTRTMVRLLLQRQRELSGLALAQAAKRLGVSSRNAYARYEQGASVPTVEKLNELLQAIAPKEDFVSTESQVNTNV
jgi:DNA-binding XRE family transcriptional regulator